MSELDRIIDLMRRAHRGDAWHGPSVMAALQGVTASHAAARAVPGAHSIWELVLHVAGWRREVARRVDGAPAQEPEGGDWPVVSRTTNEDWQRALAELQESHEALVAAVARFDEQRLGASVEDARDPALGTGVSFYVTLHGLVQHDVYHAGQIMVLKNALLRAAGRGHSA